MGKILSRIGNTHIETPQSQHPIRGKRKTLDRFPHAKYISIVKTRDEAKNYRVMGWPITQRTYGVGVLTDDNHYYFSELHTRYCCLNLDSTKRFKKALTTQYVVDENTQVVVQDNIYQYDDPMNTFLIILGSLCGIKKHKADTTQMLRRINDWTHLIKVGKNRHFCNWHKNKMIQALIDRDFFDFITEQNWVERIAELPLHRANAYLYAAVGILYAHYKGILYKYSKKYMTNLKNRRIEEALKAAYNTDQENISEQEKDNETK